MAASELIRIVSRAVYTNKNTNTTDSQYSLVLRRLPRRTEPLDGYSRVSVRRQHGLTASKKKGGSTYGRSMWVFPVTLEGSSLPFLLAEPGSHEEARTKAEEVATFLGWPVEDFVVVPAGDLGKLAPGGRGIA